MHAPWPCRDDTTLGQQVMNASRYQAAPTWLGCRRRLRKSTTRMRVVMNRAARERYSSARAAAGVSLFTSVISSSATPATSARSGTSSCWPADPAGGGLHAPNGSIHVPCSGHIKATSRPPAPCTATCDGYTQRAALCGAMSVMGTCGVDQGAGVLLSVCPFATPCSPAPAIRLSGQGPCNQNARLAPFP